MKELKIALVVQRYGAEVNGGAELYARWLAEKLQTLGEVHVITTCAVDYTTWASHYEAGSSSLNGVTIHRFPVDQTRDWQRASLQTGNFLLSERTVAEELEWIRAQGPFSTPLLNYIAQSEPDFNVFIFFTYLYATTFFGLPLVAHKAILVPMAHDDPYLRIPSFWLNFHLPPIIAYNTEAEKRLVNQVTGNEQINRDIIIGVGINTPADVSAARFRQKYRVEGDFLLYAGRIIEAKNVPELLDHFLQYQKQHQKPLKLVLIGKSHLEIPPHPDVIELGFVSEQDKFDAIRAATLVVMPSLYESLSMIVLEAWLMQKAVLVNGRCAVLKQQVKRSNGGLYYTSYAEFAATLDYLHANPQIRRQLGTQGYQFASRIYHWDTVVAKYKSIIETVAGSEQDE